MRRWTGNAEGAGGSQVRCGFRAAQAQSLHGRVVPAQTVQQDLAFGVVAGPWGEFHPEIDPGLVQAAGLPAQTDQIRPPQRQATEAIDHRLQAWPFPRRKGGVAGMCACPEAVALLTRVDGGAHLAQQGRFPRQGRVRALKHQQLIDRSQVCQQGRSGKGAQAADAEHTYPQPLRLAQVHGNRRCALHRGPLRNEKQLGVLGAKGLEWIAVAPRLAAEVSGRLFQTGVDCLVEVGGRSRCAQAPALGGLQGPQQDRVVRVVPARGPAPVLAEQQPLGRGGAGNPVAWSTEKAGDQLGRGQPNLLHGQGGLLPVHDHQARSQGLLRYPARDQGEIHRFLDVRREQQEGPGVGGQVAGFVSAAGCDRVPRQGAAAQVDHQGQAPAGGKAQQVPRRGQIRGGQEGGGAGAAHGQAYGGRQRPPGAFRHLATERPPEQVAAVSRLLGAPG